MLVRVEVADIVIVRVREHVDIEVDGGLLAFAHEVVVVGKETLVWFLRFVGGSRGCCLAWRG